MARGRRSRPATHGPATVEINTTTASVPTTSVIEILFTTTTRVVAVMCPLCGDPHFHGWPFADETVGYRTADCNLGSYEVVA